MANTIIGVNDPIEVKKWSAALAKEIPLQSFWGTGMRGKGAKTNMPIMQLTDLNAGKGGQIVYSLRANLKMKPIYGDDRAAGKSGKLDFFSDTIKIEQVRASVECGGRMAQQRTVFDLRTEGKDGLVDYFSRLQDEYGFMYASGHRGDNDFIEDTTFTGFGSNDFSAPDSSHYLCSSENDGSANTSLAGLGAGDHASISEIDKLKTLVGVMGGKTTGNSSMQPIMIDGGEHFVYVMSPRSESDMRTDTGSGKWLDIQKYLAAQLGDKSNIVKGGCGMYNNVVLKTSKNVITFSAGSSINSVTAAVASCRNLFIGRQAMTYAYGMASGDTRYQWVEKLEDGDNVFVVFAGTILGIKKTTFNGYDFGIIAHDCAAAAV